MEMYGDRYGEIGPHIYYESLASCETSLVLFSFWSICFIVLQLMYYLFFRNCPDGELFDNPSQMCRQSNLVKCNCEDRRENIKKYVKNIAAQYVARFKALREYEGAAVNISERCYENSITPVICPPDIGDDRLMPHPDDCRLFYMCEAIGQKPVCRDCPANLHFNPKLNVCDHSWNAGCMSHLVRPLPLPVEKRSFQAIPYKFPGLTKEDFNAAYEKRIPLRAGNNQCVQNSGPNADLRPDPEDCGKYYVCDSGYLISMSCPEGLHFSTVFKVCDLPQNARCQQNATETYKSEVRNPKSVQVSQEAKKLGKLVLPKELVIQCNAENGPLGSWADLRPDTEDCTKYYICDRGTIHSMNCPYGLHFSAASKVCDYPERAQCQVSSIWDRLRKEKDDSEENDKSEENSDSEENSHKYLSIVPPEWFP